MSMHHKMCSDILFLHPNNIRRCLSHAQTHSGWVTEDKNTHTKSCDYILLSVCLRIKPCMTPNPQLWMCTCILCELPATAQACTWSEVNKVMTCSQNFFCNKKDIFKSFWWMKGRLFKDGLQTSSLQASYPQNLRSVWGVMKTHKLCLPNSLFWTSCISKRIISDYFLVCTLIF